ncbi:class-III pyridoxal-phosphate-dependent aminotransferase [Bauldia litoralis]|uniref:Acetylornithine/succinyldiaminopimelate/putrescine aminotransferase n=1 Tax=Bauldia litoralis TaxID=665467 RepID=A0A1G6EC64_9HYPH|nr:aminotransferase class III-fold pyridoxal phosphate-dependent enzyme [Bauldia litoralis]SDB54920.1 Acetylornithine/succinyldiaminopimelate/putrescine aminotransferase [Bauldia litoralis]
MSQAKDDFIAKTIQYWNPGKTLEWQRVGVDLVIDRREAYYLYDMDGRRLIDLHLNGGTYSLGHRNPEVIAAVKEGMDHFDMGNHHFPALMRTKLAEMLAKHTPEGLQYSMFASGGGEAIDIALKSARHATQRKRIICLQRCYHGHTGLAVKVGDDRFSKLFLSEASEDEVTKVPFNDLDAMEAEIMKGDAACVIIESIPATYGFPMPIPGYLKAIKEMCEKVGTLYIADEVQTGLMRSGEMWCVDTYDVVPDMLVTGKGISGGIYPIAVVIANEKSASWLNEDGWGHMSSFGGAELGCIAAHKVMEIVSRPETRSQCHYISQYLRQGLNDIQAHHPDFFVGIRQRGLILGLEFDHPQGAVEVMRTCYANGIWAIYSALDPRALQFKPGLLLDRTLCDEVLNRLDTAVGQARAALVTPGRRGVSGRREAA